MTIDDEPEDEQNETLVNSNVNSLLAKISHSRRFDNRHFANRICNESCDTVPVSSGSL
jgi:hypothetical protein